jgi:hypothetical protein
MDELAEIAADTEEYYKYLNREWTSKRLKDCPTCQIKTGNQAEVESEEVIEAPKSKLSDYGRKASEDRRRLLSEIHEARQKPNS